MNRNEFFSTRTPSYLEVTADARDVPVAAMYMAECETRTIYSTKWAAVGVSLSAYYEGTDL